MDPNANLKEQQELLTATSNDDKRRRRELREALQGWLDHKGFAPTWTDYPEATKAFRVWQRSRLRFQDLHR